MVYVLIFFNIHGIEVLGRKREGKGKGKNQYLKR